MDTDNKAAYEARTVRDFVMPVEACYHCWRLPEADGDHTCPTFLASLTESQREQIAALGNWEPTDA